jgi:predicted RNA-binding Zn-ribbon protein involved in translation (DUF1610 family)
MGIINFWEYVIDNGWQVPPFPEDAEGNFICPFCSRTIIRNVKMDEIPEYDMIINCPKCGEVKAGQEEV